MNQTHEAVVVVQRKMVDEALESALRSGEMAVAKDDPRMVGASLADYCPSLEDAKVSQLVPFIEDWQRRMRRRKRH